MQVGKGTSPSRGRASPGGAGGSVVATSVAAQKLGEDVVRVMEECVDETADELVTTRLALRNMVIHIYLYVTHTHTHTHEYVRLQTNLSPHASLFAI